MRYTLRSLFAATAAFLSVNSVYALEPSPEAISLIEKSYVPGITTHIISSEEKGLSGLATCQIDRVQIGAKDPIENKLSLVTARLYQPKIFGQTNPVSRAVIVLPPIGGMTPLDEAYSLGLCTFGFRAVILEAWTPDSRDEFDLMAHDRQAVRAVTAVRRLIELLAPVRPKQIGLLGTSAGAIIGALAVGIDSRLSAAALIVGGGNLPEIYAKSTEEGLSRLREARMRAYGFTTVEEYLEALKASIRIDPLNFASYSGPKRVLTVLAEDDTVVPTATQWALYEAFGSQELIRLKASHFFAIADTAVSRHRDILTFFQANLE